MNKHITPEEFEIARRNGITRANVKSRFNYQGFSIEEAITLPLGTHRNKIGKTPLFTDKEVEQARFNGIPISLLRTRHQTLGYTKEEAINMPLGARREKKEEK